MLVDVVPDAVMGTNCWVIAREAGQECLVVDPGFDVADRLEASLEAHRLKPAAVILTHGHADHVWSVTPVCGASGAPALIHGEDADRLLDPLAAMPGPLTAMLEAHFGRSVHWSGPSDVQLLTDAARLDVAGFSLLVEHAPGHTAGSVVLSVDAVPPAQADAGLTSTLLSGDVLFAGSVGRTDLPGGDGAAMIRSLREVILPMPDDRLVLPGHGGATTIGAERATNPFLPR